MSDKKPLDSLLCNADHCCLLVIDIQTKLTATMPGKVLDRLKRNSSTLLQAADQLSIPVFVTQQYPQGLGPMIPELTQLLPKGSRLFDKTCFSCTEAEGFMSALTTTGRHQIVMAGIEAHICVLQTAIALRAAGFDVFVVSDAVSSRQRENYENAIQRMHASNIMICNTESMLFEWLRDARNTHFKTLSALIK